MTPYSTAKLWIMYLHLVGILCSLIRSTCLYWKLKAVSSSTSWNASISSRIRNNNYIKSLMLQLDKMGLSLFVVTVIGQEYLAICTLSKFWWAVWNQLVGLDGGQTRGRVWGVTLRSGCYLCLHVVKKCTRLCKKWWASKRASEDAHKQC